jgi:hypothetical protein
MSLSSKSSQETFNLSKELKHTVTGYAKELFFLPDSIRIKDLKQNEYFFQKTTIEGNKLYRLVEYNGEKNSILEQSIIISLDKKSATILDLEIVKLYPKYIRTQMNDTDIRAKNILNLLICIQNNCPRGLEINLHLRDVSDIKLILLLKNGYSFYEQYNFTYLVPIHPGIRLLKNYQVSVSDLHFANHKFQLKLKSTIIHKLVCEIENQSSLPHLILEEIMKHSRYGTFIFKNLPVTMIKKSK